MVASQEVVLGLYFLEGSQDNEESVTWPEHGKETTCDMQHVDVCSYGIPI